MHRSAILATPCVAFGDISLTRGSLRAPPFSPISVLTGKDAAGLLLRVARRDNCPGQKLTCRNGNGTGLRGYSVPVSQE